MKASLTLTLKDDLTAKLDRVKNMFSEMKKLGSALSLGKLENAGEALRNIATEARGVVTGFKSIELAADRAGASIKKGWVASKEWGKKTFGAQSRLGGIGAVAEGYSLMRPAREFADYRDVLQHIAITGGLSGVGADTEIARLQSKFNADALATGQSSKRIGEAYYEILTGGVQKDILDQAIEAHTRFATAYRVDPKDAGQLSIALLKNMNLTPKEYEEVLGATGQISKEGLFKVAGFSQYMPMITGQMRTMGMTGKYASLQALAGLQIIRRSTGDDSMAATDYRTLLEHIYAPIQERSLKMHGKQVPADLRNLVRENAGAWKTAFGVDYAGYMRTQEKAGINPLDAFLALMKKLSKAPNFTDKMRIFGQMIHTQQEGAAVQGLLNSEPEFRDMVARGMQAEAEVFMHDFIEAMRGPKPALSQFDEEVGQIERRIGEGFLPVVKLLKGGLDALRIAIVWLDARFPGFGDKVLIGVGSLLAFGAVLAAIGFIAPAIGAGIEMIAGAFGLLNLAVLANPIVLVIAALAALAIAAYFYRDEIAAAFNSLWETLKFHWIEFIKTWQQYFEEWGIAEKFRAVKESVGGAVLYLKQQFDAATTAAGDMFRALNDWDGGVIGRALKGLVEDLKAVLAPFKAIEDIAGRIGSALKIHPDAADPATDLPAFDVPGGASPRGSFVVPKQETLRGEIVVTAGPGTTVTGIKSDRAMEIRIAPDSGLVAGRH